MKKNALIVDDSRLACKIMANMLDTLDIKSVSVFSAEEAIEYLKHTLPDMLFLDHSMPGMSGLETIKLLKSNPRTATVPVLMYTAKEGEVYVGQARALGAVDVLPKGMEKNHLIKALSKLGFISLDDKSVVNDQQAAKKFVDRRKISEVYDEHPLQKDEPEWKLFWQSRVEPFLNRQKHQQSDEIRYASSQQTIKITREIHQTLEQFEHALISRLAAHDEFKSVELELEKSHFRKLMYAAVFIGLMLMAGIYWQLNKNSGLTEKLQAVLHSQQQLQNANLQIQQRIDSLEEQSTTQQVGKHSVVSSITEEKNTLATTQQSLSLVDVYGSIIASNLVETAKDSNEFLGTTTSGYHFIVNLNGKVGWPINNLYYSNADCSGNAYVDSAVARIYRDQKDQVWYVDKLAIAIPIKAVSSLNSLDQCSASNGENLTLRLIERDYNMITGIDDSQSMTLIFGN